jgi:GT2 family glycosyltransferase
MVDEGEPGAGVTVSVVVVTHDSREAIERSLPPLLDQLGEGDELIVVDNASGDRSAEAARRLAPAARVVDTGANLGYGGGCNAGAALAGGELIVFLNPDAVVRPGFRKAIARPLVDGRGWGAWQGLVTAEDGRVVNSEGGVVHFTGIAWAGGAGRRLDEGSGGAEAGGPGERPAGGTVPLRPREVGFASGACLALPRERWRELGGFPEEFFLYHEDVDLSLRLRLAGSGVGIEPAAVVDHDYEFAKGPAKWRQLERNRWATIVRTYPAALIALLLPALLATELALLGVALAGGWLGRKLAAGIDLARWLPRLLRERRGVQARRTVSAGRFARSLSAELDSPFLGSLARAAATRLAGPGRPYAGGSGPSRSRAGSVFGAASGLPASSPSPFRAGRSPRCSRSCWSSRATSWARIFVSSPSRELATEKCSRRTKMTPKAPRKSALEASSAPVAWRNRSSSSLQTASTSSTTASRVQSNA